MTIDQPWGVSVFGQGDVHVEPDYAVLRLAINRIDGKPDRALAAARKSASSLRGAVRKLRVAESDITSSQLRVHSAWDGYGSTASSLVINAGLSSPSEWPTLAGSMTSSSRSWMRAPTKSSRSSTTRPRKQEVRAEARRVAVAAARLKAELYAEAAGVALGLVVHIEDVDPERLRAEMHRGAGGGPRTQATWPLVGSR